MSQERKDGNTPVKRETVERVYGSVEEGIIFAISPALEAELTQEAEDRGISKEQRLKEFQQQLLDEI